MELNDIYRFSLPNNEDWEYYSQTEPCDYLQGVLESIQHNNRFFVDFRFYKLLYWFSKESPQYAGGHISLNGECNFLYRARVFDKEKDKKARSEMNDSTINADCFRGYNKVASFVPQTPSQVKNGRANPEGIVYLYAASDPVTAVAEVDAPLKADVSVAKIAINQDLRILNFANLYAFSTGTDDKVIEWKRNIILELTRIFNTPASGNKYLLCQYISEFAKNIGFDGIAFWSSKVKINSINGQGINYTIFSYDKCEAISSDLYYVANHILELKKADKYGIYQPIDNTLDREFGNE